MTKPPFTPIIKEGWLMKEGGFIHNWKKRWFVLGRGPMKYFVSKYKDEKGSFNITKDTVITNARGPKNEPALYIKTTGRTYYLVAERETEAVAWINTLNKVINAMKDGTINQLEGEVVNQFTNSVFTNDMLVPQYNDGDLNGYFNPLPHMPITQKQVFQLPSNLNAAYRIYIDIDFTATQLIKRTSDYIRSISASPNGIVDPDKCLCYDDFYKMNHDIGEMCQNMHQIDYSELTRSDVQALVKDFGITTFTDILKSESKYETNLKRWIDSANKMLSLYDEAKEADVDGLLHIQRQFPEILQAIDNLQIPDNERETFAINEYMMEHIQGNYLKEKFKAKITFASILKIFYIFNQIRKEIEDGMNDAVNSGNEDVTKYFIPRNNSFKTFTQDLLNHIYNFTKRTQPTAEEKTQITKDFDAKVRGIDQNIITDFRNRFGAL